MIARISGTYDASWPVSVRIPAASLAPSLSSRNQVRPPAPWRNGLQNIGGTSDYPERGIGVVIMSNSTTGYDYRALFSLTLRTPWTGSS